ncbi:hypothetical protein SNE40_003738 [Patella caerulea]|uniref:Uncharacterized protein n=1 Tax=Patella caerulea TaxID=87958 RepID=A0AAN8K8J8_PATCE
MANYTAATLYRTLWLIVVRLCVLSKNGYIFIAILHKFTLFSTQKWHSQKKRKVSEALRQLDACNLRRVAAQEFILRAANDYFVLDEESNGYEELLLEFDASDYELGLCSSLSNIELVC